MEEKIKELEKKIDSNYNEIVSNMNRLHNHEEQINKNTNELSALKVLHSIKETYMVYTNRFFVMWITTFIALLCSLIYIVLG